ncbi:glycosyltransferase family 2 protein [Lunatimonas salinarum]|uniref:glycosyltransferase family 2 protein n=1 Tax=Lunatimonas salinarum TaxID=1774590 RepID=UPI001ADEE8F5|nr:glycosyltransferase family 2 protein [Lunatimonas salinarum]
MISISIVIPTYNRAHVLSRAIDSVLSQTYSNWELLIVDDGSSDNTEVLVADYIKKDARIKYFKRPEDRLRGGNACRNIGAERAAGKYVAYLDSDDYWKETRLVECVKFIEKEQPDCFYSGITSYNNYRYEEVKSRAIQIDETALDFLVNWDTTALPSTYLLKKEILSDIIWDETLLRHQDWDFFIRISKKNTWKYFENHDVYYVKERKKFKYIDILSCLKVYNKYKNELTNKKKANKYLRLMMEYCSKSFTHIKYVKKYNELLIENNYTFTIRDLFQIKYPYLFFILFKIKRQLIDPIKMVFQKTNV